LRKAIRQLKQRCDDLQVHSISRSVHHVRQFSFSRQAQNDAAAAAAVGGGLEETLMGVEEYGTCCAGSVFAGNGFSLPGTIRNSQCCCGATRIC
jgi:hypothetical protein